MTQARVLAEIEVKQYAINLLDSLGKEITAQFEKWNKPKVGFLDLLCGAHDDAAGDQAAVFKQAEEEKAAAQERAMLVFSILQLAATDWLGAVIELKLVPKIASRYSKTNFSLPANWIADMKRRGVIKPDISTKVFGDFSNDLMDLFWNVTGSKVLPSSPFTALNGNNVPYAPLMTSFAQSLYLEVDKQQRAATGVVNQYSEALNRSQTAGKELVDVVLEQVPGVNVESRIDIVGAAKDFINAYFNDYRRSWADRWYYYGYDPPLAPRWKRIRHQLELHLWGVWIGQQNFATLALGGDLFRIVGASGELSGSGGFAKEIKDSPVVTHLFEEFNAPIMRMILEGDTWDTVEEVREQIKKLNDWATSLDTKTLVGDLEGKKRDLKPVDQMWQ